MLVARGMSDARAARDLARQIGETMADAFLLQGRELHVSAAVGLAQAPADGADLDALLQIARRRSRLGRRPAAPGACG
jgi:predicted signal transduction protein with EAL and GGDEF domain